MTRYRHIVVLLAVLFISTYGANAWAGGSPHAHDGGFFLRLSGGFSSLRTEFRNGLERHKFTGGGFELSAAAGLIVAENLAVHGSLWGWLITDPTYEIDGERQLTNPQNLNMAAIGVGLTYFFMPYNAYISASVGPAKVSAKQGSSLSSTDVGVGFESILGKEWWVGDEWGVGIAGVFGYHSVGLKGSSENSGGATFGARLSVTMN